MLVATGVPGINGAGIGTVAAFCGTGYRFYLTPSTSNGIATFRVINARNYMGHNRRRASHHCQPILDSNGPGASGGVFRSRMPDAENPPPSSRGVWPQGDRMTARGYFYASANVDPTGA